MAHYVVELPQGQDDCGHKHRTAETADRCRARLLGMHRSETGTWECSAYWYGSRVVEYLTDSERREREASICWDPRPVWARNG